MARRTSTQRVSDDRPVSSMPMSDPSLPREVRGRRPRRLSLFIALALFLGVLGLGAWGANYYRDCQEPAEGPRRAVRFTVEGGTTGEQVVRRLHEEGVIPCDGFVGNLLLRGTGKADRIRSGSFELTTGMTL